MFIFVLLGLIMPVYDDEISITPESIRQVMEASNANDDQWIISKRKEIFKQVENIMLRDARYQRQHSGIHLILSEEFAANLDIYKERYIIVPSKNVMDKVSVMIKRELLRKGFSLEDNKSDN